MNTRLELALCWICIAFAFEVYAQDIHIDGVLDDDMWLTAPTIKQTYQVLPQTLEKQTDVFSVQHISTRSGLYIGLTARINSPLRLRTQENDSTFTNDHFQIMLDMNNNAQESFVFGINHQGNYFDGIYDLDKELDLDWDAEWEYQVTTNGGNWLAEIFIPWGAMPFAVQAQNQFGLYVSRFDENSNATYATVPANQQMNSLFQQFTKYSVTIEGESNFDLFPYVSFNRNVLQHSHELSAGAEIFWQPTAGHRLSAAINPDFGQVESDELVVNFSAVESFFSEKRPFFNNNQSLFAVTGPETLTVVHTPRIGGSSFYDDEHNGQLNSAVKYTVNINDFDVGIISAFEDTTERGAGRDFVALRGQYSFSGSKLGLSINHVATPILNRKATVISSDLHVALSEDTSLNFGIIKANIQDENGSEHDIGYWLTASSDNDEQHSHDISLFSYGDKLQLNDIGFVKRVNRKQIEYEYQYQISNVDSTFIREMTFVAEAEYKTNFQHDKLPNVIGSGVEVLTKDEFEYELSLELASSGFDDLVTRGNRSLWLPSSEKIELEVASPEYLWGQYELGVAVGTEGLREYFYDVQASIAKQYDESLHIQLTVTQYNSDSWIDWDEDNTVSEFNFTEQEIELSIDYQFDDNQELRIKFEAVIGKARSLNTFDVQADGSLLLLPQVEDFSFAENAFQLRYKYSFSKLTAFYLSYGFGGEYEDEFAKFGKRNLYKKAINSKNAHNIFAKIRLHF